MLGNWSPVVVMSPTDEDRQKLFRRGGVYVQVRRTVCGELFTIMTEIDRKDMATRPGFKIKGQHVGGPDGSRFGSCIWATSLRRRSL